MENIKLTVKDTTIVLEIDATQDLGLSKTGKTRLVATSQGNQKVSIAGREIYIGLNAFTK